MNEYSPIVSEFDTPEQEASYLEWLKRKVAESLADPRPPVPHDQVMVEMREVIAKAKQKKPC
ncbi:MAG: antitoxin [Alphaproteobacteria bacterium]|nr:MAG: antitoxin [Alphaproteobacteria bacterium]